MQVQELLVFASLALLKLTHQKVHLVDLYALRGFDWIMFDRLQSIRKCCSV